MVKVSTERRLELQRKSLVKLIKKLNAHKHFKFSEAQRLRKNGLLCLIRANNLYKIDQRSKAMRMRIKVRGWLVM